MDKKGCKKSGPEQSGCYHPQFTGQRKHYGQSGRQHLSGYIGNLYGHTRERRNQPGIPVETEWCQCGNRRCDLYQCSPCRGRPGKRSAYFKSALQFGKSGHVQYLTASLLSPPNITGQPASVSQCAGTNVTFTVTATGSGLTYQWKKNAVNIGGATNASYTINNISAGDAASYTVTVTGTCGTVTSAAAVLTISTAPAITGQPASATQCVGTNVTFTVTATGTGLTYQWRKGGVNIAGATGASYTINNIALTDAATYTVVITGTCGTVTSNNCRTYGKSCHSHHRPACRSYPVHRDQRHLYGNGNRGGTHLPVEKSRCKHCRCHRSVLYPEQYYGRQCRQL